MLLLMAVKQRIINLSKIKNMSLLELSRRANVPYSTIMNFMCGHGNTITLTTLSRICLGFNIKLQEFFDSELFYNVLDEHEKKSKKVKVKR